MAVPLRGATARVTRARLSADTVERFHDLHEELHTYAARDEEPILRSVRVQAVGRRRQAAAAAHRRATRDAAAALAARGAAYFGGRFVDTPVYDGRRSRAGQAIHGPAIVEERFTTIVVYPGQQRRLDPHGNYRLTVG